MERKEIFPQVIRKAREIVKAPIGLVRETHQVASNIDQLGCETLGVAKTRAIEAAIVTPPHALIGSIILGNEFLFVASSMVALAEVASVIAARVSNPDDYQGALNLYPKQGA